MWILIMVAID